MKAAIKPPLEPMNYRRVKLLPSRFKDQFDQAVEYFLALPDDDILLGYRRRAGLKHPGRELGGWYSNDGSYDIYSWDEIFNTFGQWLSFFGRAYGATGDARLRDKADNLMREWEKTIDADGYFFYSGNSNGWHYAYEKMMSGLTDLYIHAGLSKAKDLLDRITDWAEKNLQTFRLTAGGDRASFTGGEPGIGFIDNEWYTLSEGLYRMYLASGDERYRRFAEVWHYDAYWEALREGRAERMMTGVHGYSHVNTLGGAAMAYVVTGDAKYLEAIVGGYETLKRHQMMASGGYAFDEHMAGPDGSNYRAVERIPRSYEVPCGSWAALKLTRHLTSLTGEARYGEWAETTIYNALGAALPMSDDDRRRGRTFYYADYCIGGGRKVYFEHSFPCCSGTYPQALAEYFNAIYYAAAEALYIAQYLPSSVEADIGGKPVALEISGDYPEHDTIRIVIGTDGSFKLCMRVPSWLEPGKGEALLNGQSIELDMQPGSWAEIWRDWHEGDTLALRFPMPLWTWPICPQHPERAALMYGPLMLAALGRHHTLKGNVGEPAGIARRREGLHFAGTDSQGGQVEFVPYYEIGEKVWNTVYCDYTL